MSALWTPPSVSREEANIGAEHVADVRLAAALRGQLEWWTRELKQIDDRLEMVWFDESATGIVGVVPNRYAIVRWNEAPTPPSVIPIEGPDGEFVEPNSSVFDKVRAGDMWNAEARRDRQRRQEQALAAKRRQQARETEERQEEILERWLAASRTQVSFNPDVAWSQNAAGQRAARAEKAKRERKAA